MRPWILLLALLCAGCVGFGDAGRTGGDDDDSASPGDDDDDDGDDDDTPADAVPESMICTPASNPTTFDHGSPASVELALVVEWSDGSFSAPGSGVIWTIQDDFGGSIDSTGTYTTPMNHGGQVEIEAWYDGVYGTCTLDLFIEMTVDLVGDPALSDAAETTVPTYDDACGPAVVYPLDGAKLPRDLPSPLVQWSNPAASSTFVVTATNTYATLTVITADASWRPDEAAWFTLSGEDAGSDVSVQTAGGVWDGANLVGLCAPTTPTGFELGFFGTQSTVFYWSPSTAGLWKIDVGSETPESWLNEANAGYCVGCHSANLANAARMTMNFGGGDGWSVVSEVGAPLPPVVPAETRRGNFMTLDPTGTKLVRSYQGALYLDDIEANAQLAQVPTTGYATHPDWSPDGTKLAYSSCGSADADWVAFNCSIATIDILPDGSFGASVVVVPAGENTYYYPSWSPDSQWLAFNQAPASGANNDSNDNPLGQVGIVPGAGGAPRLLSLASGGPGLSNSWPRWGPVEGDIGWIAFSSRRSYGNVVSGTAQIWMAAVDLDNVFAVDPSWAPMWLPGQAISSGNHTPIWVPRYTPE